MSRTTLWLPVSRYQMMMPSLMPRTMTARKEVNTLGVILQQYWSRTLFACYHYKECTRLQTSEQCNIIIYFLYIHWFSAKCIVCISRALNVSYFTEAVCIVKYLALFISLQSFYLTKHYHQQLSVYISVLSVSRSVDLTAVWQRCVLVHTLVEHEMQTNTVIKTLYCHQSTECIKTGFT